MRQTLRWKAISNDISSNAGEDGKAETPSYLTVLPVSAGASEELGKLGPAFEISFTADNVDEFAQVWERSMNMQWKLAGDSYTDRYLAQVWDNMLRQWTRATLLSCNIRWQEGFRR